MALHPDFPESPYAILDPALRWFPADETLRDTSMEKLMPPLVPELRKKVKEWRDSGYVGAMDTSKSLLNWWFNTPHLLPKGDGTMAEFQYYFARREALDIEIPILTPRAYREYKNLAALDVGASGHARVAYRQFSEEEQREIVFKDITTGEVTHTTILDTAGVADYRSVIGYFAQTIMKDMRLVSGYDVLYGKVKAFVQDDLFDRKVELESPNTLRNLSEPAAAKTLLETFKKAINALTVQDKGDAEIRDTIKLRQTRPFVAKDQGYLIPRKSVFNRIIGDSRFELLFARFLEDCDDVVSYAKNYLAVNFKLDYVKADGDISNYYPDFLVKLSDKRIVIVETKGQEDLDVPQKMARLRQWCEDINRVQPDVKYAFVYVDQESFEKFKPVSFRQLVDGFREYKEKI
jgi:type III restriction enzyme